MHVEIKVAQNFVLNFLYNKLPRRRVNLFGEELESALRDKFADHWYPDKPFKGSAFRCLKITDPADPVLNRAARESGNPVPDIVENLPTDLAIWIDPGEVSYRMGEKGSVKILYSESMDPSYLQSYAIAPDDASPEASAVAAATAAAIAAANSFHPVSGGRGPVAPGPSGANFLPLDNLNLAMGGLSMNQANSPSSQQVSPGSVAAVQGVQGSQSSQSKTVGAPPGGPGPVSVSAGMSSQANSGFAPFQPRPHQPITYTAGTFAQTKFGSTKLKSNAKKTNRMSPTEFSNYIKQRAMQKQATAGGPPGGSAPTNMPNGFVGGGGGRGPMNNRGGNGGHGNLNYGGGSGRIPPHQQNPDPYFYPLFPDRTGGGGNQNNGGFGYQTTGGGNGTSSSGSAAIPAFGSSGSSSGSSSASSTTSNPWSFGDADAELFLQDILTVGLNSSKTHTTNNKLDLGFSNNGESNNSFGLGNFHFGSNGTSSNFVGSTNGSSSFFGLEDSFGNGVAKPIRSPQGSPAGENATGTNSSEKYQQRVLVAN